VTFEVRGALVCKSRGRSRQGPRIVRSAASRRVSCRRTLVARCFGARVAIVKLRTRCKQAHELNPRRSEAHCRRRYPPMLYPLREVCFRRGPDLTDKMERSGLALVLVLHNNTVRHELSNTASGGH
jgi:hypothetical protein